jgi:hypothetical protein
MYKPCGYQQTLGGAPKYQRVLIPPQSATASKYARTCRVLNGQHRVINNLLVGNLGNKEILVTAHADGDIVAWYTDGLYEFWDHDFLKEWPKILKGHLP